MTSNRRDMILLLVLSGTIISICMGLRQSLGLFMRPMTLDLGISAATFGFTIALQNIVWGLGQPLFGWIADRFGDRKAIWLGFWLYLAGNLRADLEHAADREQQLRSFPIRLPVDGRRQPPHAHGAAPLAPPLLPRRQVRRPGRRGRRAGPDPAGRVRSSPRK